MFRLRSARCTLSTTSTGARRGIKTLGIRAEDPKRIWERRTPLIPSAIAKLTESGARVLIESCSKRIYRDALFEEAGARIVEKFRLDECDLVLGIKEIPLAELANVNSKRTTHLFFSHTHKAQRSNLPLLSSMLASSSRFVDYELLTTSSGERTTAFGFLAGVAGMADGFSQLALKLLARGRAGPLLQLPRPYMMSSLEELRSALRVVGRKIREEGMSEDVRVVLAGKGRVGEGARSVLDDIDAEWISLSQLQSLASSPRGKGKIYACQLELSDYLSRFDGAPFDRETYRSSPESYFSEFDTKVAPHTTLLLNGGFWSSGYPRLLTLEQLSEFKSKPDMEERMLGIVDVACDYDGALEFVKGPTTIDDPCYQLDPHTGENYRSLSQPNSIQISSIEILPSELPLDASIQFSTSLLPYVESLLADSTSSGKDEMAIALRRATIVEDGRLGEGHEWLAGVLEGWNKEGGGREKKKVLMLGSGLVASPAVRILTSRPDISLTIASNDLPSAQSLAKLSHSISVVPLDVSDTTSLSELIAEADIVISLLPAGLHVRVAESCIEHGVGLVTASYVSEEMRALDGRAKAAGVILLNELGLDPGIDHMSAMKLIEQARAKGNTIDSFISFCGGLPAPEFAQGVLGYKFSWSPRGVLTAALNPATYRLSSRAHNIPSTSLLSSSFPSIPILHGFSFEGIPNRDSISYLQEYGLEEDLPSILRGTLRYPGFARTVEVMRRIGLLDFQVMERGLERWNSFVDVCLEKVAGRRIEGKEMRREVVVGVMKDEEGVDEALSILEQLSLIPSSHIPSTPLPSLPSIAQAPLDLLSLLLANQLAYGKDERDMVVLHHELGTITPGGERELMSSSMIQFGVVGGDSAMATTVGMPIALGALLILDGKITERGIVSPASVEVWRPLLGDLEKHGVRMTEEVLRGSVGVLKTLRRVRYDFEF